MDAVAELTEVDTLPGAERQSTVHYRNGDRRADKGRFDMGRHVVRAFEGMNDKWLIFRNDLVHEFFKILADIGIGILIDANARRCMSDKNIEQSVVRDIIQSLNDLTGDQVDAATAGWKGVMDVPYHPGLDMAGQRTRPK